MTIPQLSPCGLAVGWLRRCYKSRWFLFRDSPLTTPGRYYFCPDDTPHLDGIHQFGSREWYDKNVRLEQGLGEDLRARHVDDRGLPPTVLPFAQRIGNPADFRDGESPNRILPYDQLQDGFNQACFVGTSGPLLLRVDRTWETVSEFAACGVQYFYATILKWSYAALAVQIAEAFRLFCPSPATVVYHPEQAFLPAVTTVKTPTCSVCVIDGTRDFQTLALQAFLGITRPRNIGIFGTNLLHYTASNYVVNTLNGDGIDPTKPIMLVGHSYGAVVALLTAARFRAGRPDRLINYLTFADPKPGDGRLITLLERCLGLSIAADSDLVTTLPPDVLQAYPVAVALGVPQLMNWISWIRPPNQQMMDLRGRLFPSPSIFLDFITLRTFAIQAINHQNISPIPPHAIDGYRNRIDARCPLPEWPLSVELWSYLHGAGIGGDEDAGHVNVTHIYTPGGGDEDSGHVNPFTYMPVAGGDEDSGAAIIPVPNGGDEDSGAAIIPVPNGGDEDAGHG